MNTKVDSSSSRLSQWAKHSLFFKIASIALIIILLMIPNSLIRDLIQERDFNQKAVIGEVSSKWGMEQRLVGPVLTIPYKTFYEDADGKITEMIKYGNFLPEQLAIDGQINSETRKRGIYKAILYQTNSTFQGHFNKPDFKRFAVDTKHILYDQAFLQVSIPDMTGINENIELSFGGENFRMEPGIEKINGFNSGVKIPVEIDPSKDRNDFEFELNLNGSNALTFGPIGKETTVKLGSNWASPRSARYALLVISLTFLLFFFFEVINGQKVHPMHYILVGSAVQ